jgi:hypothetical protein
VSLTSKQAIQIVTGLATASRLGWDVTVKSGRGSFTVSATRVALFAGTRPTQYDTGISFVRRELNDALGHLLTVILLESTPLEGDPELRESEHVFNHERDVRGEVRP